MAAVASMITARPVLSVQKASKASFSGSVRALKATRSVSVARSAFVVTAERKLWKPDSEPPAHLDGTMPGDYGFDPLGLGQDPARLKWYQEAELMNGRWAMMAVAGILFTSALGISDGKWFLSGAKPTEIPTLALLSIQFPVMGMLEAKRLDGYQATGGSGLMNSYPFDPMGMDSPDRRVKEVKNGRLAMLAFAGFMVQALVTREGPLDNLSAHMGDALNNNFITSIANIQNVV